MALLDDLETMLVAQSITGGATGWALFLGHLPPTPDKAVVIYETGGAASEVEFGLDYPTFQVMVRGEAGGYQAVRTKIQAIFEILHNSEENMPGSSYVNITGIQSAPLSLGRDETKRPQLSWNFRSIVNRV